MAFGLFSSIFPIIFIVFFVVIIGVMITTAVRGGRQWHRNNQSPVLTVEATVVTKRSDVRRHHDADQHSHSSTSYYATFQVASGDRMELAVSGSEYGYLVEGDHGQLTFQGTRYQGFQRT